MGNTNDEIDLLELFAKGVLVVKTNLVILILAFVIGSGLGLAYHQFSPKIYEGKMILLSDILTESYSERITESLDKLIKEGNTKTLSERLGITEESAEKIEKIEIESIQQEDAVGEKESSTFVITVETTDNSILKKLQDGIINLLKNNDFVQIRVSQRQNFYKIMIKKVGEEINSLDSLKKRLFNGQPVYSKSSEMLLVDPTNIYSKIIELTAKQIEYKNALELVNSIQLVEGFTIFQKPVSPKLSISLASGASLGLVFVFVFIGIRAIREIVLLAENKVGKP